MFSIRCNSSDKIIKKSKKIRKKIERFINNYDREGIDFLSEKDDCKKFEKNIVTNAVNVVYAKKEIIYPATISKDIWNLEKQVVILIISDGEKRHYLGVKKLSA